MSKMDTRSTLSRSLLPLLAVLLSTTRMQLASARGNSRDTTLATFNVGLVESYIGPGDARVTVMIDQVRKYKRLNFLSTQW